MRGVKSIRVQKDARQALQAKRRKDGFILTAFNVGIVTFFTAVYFLSLLGFAL
jgi:hypothetical protein